MFNRGDLAAADAYFGPEFFNHAGPQDWPHGPEGIKRTVTMLRTAFPDLHYKVEEVIVEGNTFAARWTARGTHQGPFQGPVGSVPAANFPATGRQVGFQGITLGRIINGKGGESWVLMDQLGLLRQLGVLPGRQP